ncbi:MAG: Cna B-type domain-containing protein [Anaerovoracaceae bacterium]
MVPDADGKWKYTFTAPKYDENDKEIVYSVKESAVAGFHASYEGYNILNTYIKPVTVALPKVYKEVRAATCRNNCILLEGQDGSYADVSKTDS